MISVCIPAIETHLPFLERCLDSICSQILIPYEVVISLSNITSDIYAVITNVESRIEKYQSKLWIRVLYTSDKRYAGENRNIAAGNARGTIISFIDIDDIMYPHRLYIINRVFEEFPDYVGVMHYFTENTISEPVWNYSAHNVSPYQFSPKIHYGHPSFRAKILDEFQYSDLPRTQDFDFIERLLPKYLHNLAVYKHALSCYNSNDSTYYSAQNNILPDFAKMAI